MGVSRVRFLTFSVEPPFGSSPFTAPNSRSPPKFDHSLSFTLLPKYTRATLHHGRPCPGPNHEAPSSPTRASAPPRPTHYPPPTTHSLFASIICTTWRQYLSRSQQLPHTSRLHGRVRLQFQILSVLSMSLWQIPCSQQFAASCASLCALFRAPFLCFQSFGASFHKTPGWGVPQHFLRQASLPSTPTPLLLITSLQPLYFHAITHSFAQRRTNISTILNSLRTLSITTGVVPPATAVFRTPCPLCCAFSDEPTL